MKKAVGFPLILLMILHQAFHRNVLHGHCQTPALQSCTKWYICLFAHVQI